MSKKLPFFRLFLYILARPKELAAIEDLKSLKNDTAPD
jgi:hypothetical protein